MGFKYAPKWAIEEYKKATYNTEKVLLKRLTLHQPNDREYGEIIWEDMEDLTASPLIEVLIIQWDELFYSIVYHQSLEVVDSCRGLKFALELGYKDYVKPLICNMVGVTKKRIRRRGNNDVNKRLLMDFREGHLNTWCLENILDMITDDNFKFDRCPKVPEYIRENLELNLTFKFVASVDLSGNSLDRIPDSLLFLTEITHLNLLNNDIEYIPDVPFFANMSQTSKQPLPSLKVLNISSNCLEGIIPLWIICHKKLEKLSLAMNKLDFVEDNKFDELGIKDFTTKLRDVNLQKNKLTFIPRYIQYLKETSDLNMSNNEIKRVPSEIWMLFKLMNLDLADNKIEEIEYPCKDCASYNIGDQEDTNQTKILEGIKVGEDYCRLRELKLSGNQLKNPPNGLVCITPKLLRLNVKDNKNITYLDLRFLPKFLRYLDYSGCGIKQIIFSEENTPCFASSINLVHQGLCDHLKHRHEKFFFLSELYLNGNKNLENIILGEEDDKEIPYFPSLKYLHLHENNLLGLPPRIGYQKNLETLDISDNPNLRELPKELGNLKIYKKLQSLRRDNLKLEGIHEEVSLPVVLNILRSIGTKCHLNRRFKLALVGYHGTGKTTLLKTLQSKRINDIHSTEGIDINKWDLINPDDKLQKIEFEVWDFAGQQDYYPTLHCFLSPRSVYLLVFRACDRQKGISELEGWLKSLEMMAPGCPVLLVGTHIDEIEQESLQNLAQEILIKYHPDKGPFPRIADICFITCKPGLIASNKEQVKGLKKAIFEVASHLHVGNTNSQVTYKPKLDARHPNAFINQKVPEIYKRLETCIVVKAKEMKKNNLPPFVNFEELWTTIGTELFKEKDLLQDGLEYLHHLGLVLNFETTRLREIYFLDPQWLSKSMTILIRDHHIRPTYQSKNNNETFLLKLLDTGIVDRYQLKSYLNDKNQQFCEWTCLLYTS
ncbi:hypothetical protein LOD99_11144 [Oopsacas minuta]|uniref:non-specific serine/threonine protein kinase n=1 Tax=Oopsacas minuta TaxID=111878 RepID=A0AAV7K7P8_9METZ|nr:hypothetical protein LOD99_11144 [Oopsacas minuta]